MASDPVAVYSERLLEVRREFLLYENRVVVKARWLARGSFEHTVKLGALQREPRRFTIRYRLHRYAGWVLAVGSLLFAMVYYRGEHEGLFGYAALTLAVLGAIAVALTYPLRRIQFARFDPVSGRGGLDIGSAGNDEATFLGFVRAVEREIRRQR